MAITSAFQADDAGSIPAARSKSYINLTYLFEKQHSLLSDFLYLQFGFVHFKLLGGHLVAKRCPYLNLS